MRIARLGMASVFLSSVAFSSTATYTVNVPGDTHLPHGTFTAGVGDGGTGDLRGCLFHMTYFI